MPKAGHQAPQVTGETRTHRCGHCFDPHEAERTQDARLDERLFRDCHSSGRATFGNLISPLPHRLAKQHHRIPRQAGPTLFSVNSSETPTAVEAMEKGEARHDMRASQDGLKGMVAVLQENRTAPERRVLSLHESHRNHAADSSRILGIRCDERRPSRINRSEPDLPTPWRA